MGFLPLYNLIKFILKKQRYKTPGLLPFYIVTILLIIFRECQFIGAAAGYQYYDSKVLSETPFTAFNIGIMLSDHLRIVIGFMACLEIFEFSFDIRAGSSIFNS